VATFRIGPWRWDGNLMGGSFNPPIGASGGIVLKQPPAKGSDGGVGVFSFADGATIPADYTPVTASALASLLAIGLPQGDTPNRLLFDTLTRLSDPDGLAAPGPLMPDRSGLSVFLSGELLHRELFSSSHAHYNRFRDRRRGDFRKLYLGGIAKAQELRTLSGILPNTWNQIRNSTDQRITKWRSLLLRAFRAGLTVTQVKNRIELRAQRAETHARRVLDYWRIKHQVPWQELVPADLLPDVPGPLPHETTLNESFNAMANNELLVGGASDIDWLEQTSYADWKARNAGHTSMGMGKNSSLAGVLNVAWTDTNLSSDDHKVRCVLPLVGVLYAGPVSRYDETVTAAGTFYCALGDSSATYITRMISGTQVNIGTYGGAVNNGDTLEIESDGSSHTARVNGSDRIYVTDTNIFGYTAVGVTQFLADNTYPAVDDWHAEDLSAGGITAEVPAGVITLSAVEPATTKSTEVSIGTIAVSALTPTIAKGADVPAGALAVSAIEPTTTKAATIDAGAVAVTGVTPGSTKAEELPTGLLAVTGLPPDTTGSNTLPSGLATVSGLATGVSKVIPVGPEAITVLSVAPTAAKAAPIPPGSVTVTSGDIETGGSASIPAGLVTITGVAPFVPQFAPLPVGLLSVTAAVPVTTKAATLPIGLIRVTTFGFNEGFQPKTPGGVELWKEAYAVNLWVGGYAVDLWKGA
jgi:hypothetical protein